eukprot:TRINITY_DN4662_c0_g2_i1.p1 TRINITY_DN4662_c0_g2~~TRINITY_DN4662_c0_g2_i1.p1  ORF type:complete len:862 (-),score=281.88 TRINITY_DN4662_c0_g2_i1:64-2649(-)
MRGSRTTTMVEFGENDVKSIRMKERQRLYAHLDMSLENVLDALNAQKPKKETEDKDKPAPAAQKQSPRNNNTSPTKKTVTTNTSTNINANSTNNNNAGNTNNRNINTNNTPSNNNQAANINNNNIPSPIIKNNNNNNHSEEDLEDIKEEERHLQKLSMFLFSTEHNQGAQATPASKLPSNVNCPSPTPALIFSGKSAVDAISSKLQVSREDALFLCQKLLSFKLITALSSKDDNSSTTKNFTDSDSSFYIPTNSKTTYSIQLSASSKIKQSKISTLLKNLLEEEEQMRKEADELSEKLEAIKTTQRLTSSSNTLSLSRTSSKDPPLPATSSSSESLQQVSDTPAPTESKPITNNTNLSSSSPAPAADKESEIKKKENKERLRKEAEDTMSKLERVKAELAQQERELAELLNQKKIAIESAPQPLVVAEPPKEVNNNNNPNANNNTNANMIAPPKMVDGKYEWEIEADEVTIIQKDLGKGGFASVAKAKWRGSTVALKRLLIGRKEPSERFIREINILMKIRHPNIVLSMGASINNEDAIFLVMEYAEKGNLHDVIVNELPPWSRRLSFARDILRGLNYLHAYKPNPIIHRDLKSQNILILSNYTAKICDFGLAKEEKILEHQMSLLGTTLKWMPPEMLNDPPDYTLESDMYVLGLILWEIITGLWPFEKTPMGEFLRGLQSEVTPLRPEIPDEKEWLALGEGRRDYKEIMCKCWEYSPSKRLKGEEALNRMEEIIEFNEKNGTVTTPRVANKEEKKEVVPEKKEVVAEKKEAVVVEKKEEGLVRGLAGMQGGNHVGEVVGGKREKDRDKENRRNENTGSEVFSPGKGGVNWRGKFSSVLNPEHFKKSKKKLKPVDEPVSPK